MYAAAMAWKEIMGLWKIAAVENLHRPLWEQAAWAFWNDIIGNEPHAAVIPNIGAYLLYASNVPYPPPK